MDGMVFVFWPDLGRRGEGRQGRKVREAWRGKNADGP